MTLNDAASHDDEVTGGTLACAGCSARYPVRNGIPELLRRNRPSAATETARTAERFGYLWSRSNPQAGPRREYHFEKMAAALQLEEPRGLVLEAGCGDGIDLANHASRTGVEVIGVELSEGGCRTSAGRIRAVPTAHVVRADLCELPFADQTFDRVFSYGVLHHVASPPAAAAELARVSRPGAEVAVYLYEDFRERAAGWRLLLALVNSFRAVTTRVPPRWLFVMCQLGSPLVYLLFTVPHRLLRPVPGLRALAQGLPFRHGKGPFALAGDLYDRFSAPIEHRYGHHEARELLRGAGLSVTQVAYERGWMLSARADRPR